MSQSTRGWRAKFSDALRGIGLACRGEKSFVVHSIATALVVAAAALLQVTPTEWCLMTLCIAAVFAAETFGGLEGDLSMGSQFGVQALAALITIVYTAVASFALVKLTGAIVPLRVDAAEEEEGLDISLHEESGYKF